MASEKASRRVPGVQWQVGGAAAVIAAIMAGCGAVPAGVSGDAKGPATEVVGARAAQRWEALIAGDVQRAYGFLSPGTRQANSLAAYSGSLKLGTWKGARVTRVECPEADRCEAHLEIDYVVRGTKITSPLMENWVHAEGNWWLVMK